MFVLAAATKALATYQVATEAATGKDLGPRSAAGGDQATGGESDLDAGNADLLVTHGTVLALLDQYDQASS